MSESMQCHIHIKNSTEYPFTLSESKLDHGKWKTNPPTQIEAGDTASFYSEGDSGTWTGTEGYVTYTLPDNETTSKISFDIPYSGSNSGGMVVDGPSASTYTAEETDSSYENVASFPSSGDSVKAYFAIGSA